MIWHYEGPRHVELSNREQQLLGISKAFPDRDHLSEVLFKPRRPSWRAEKAVRLAAEIMVHEMAAELPEVFDHQNIFDETYDMTPLERPGIILGSDVHNATFAYGPREAALLGLPQRVTEANVPCAGVIALEHVLPYGKHSFWRHRDALREIRNDSNGYFKEGLSALAGAFSGNDGMAQFNMDTDASLAYTERAIAHVREWCDEHNL